MVRISYLHRLELTALRQEIFISYSHKDARHLAELRQFLVPFEREYGITVWSDQKIQPGTLWEMEIKQALERARVAVLLVTANFLASNFVAESELPKILRDAERGGLRIIWVAVSASSYHLTEIAKYQAANEPSKPLDTMTGSKRRAAWVEIASRIFASSNSWDTHNTLQGQENSQAPSGHNKSILLAQTTDDVEDEADQVKQYLNQYRDEINVLPLSTYPQGGEAFRIAFEEDLARADLFVQLLGRRSGRLPPDLPEGYLWFQLKTAKAAGVPIMHWRHPALDVNSVTDPLFAKLLTSDTVIASGLEAFKRQLLTWTRKPKQSTRVMRSSTVFINADEKDLAIAKEIERECLRNALTAILPMAGPSSETIRKDLTENLIECDVLVFIYGNTTQEWIRSQLRFFNKVRPNRESSPRLMAICSGPPPKPDIGISFPDARLIECPEDWNLEPVWKLISELEK